MSLLAQLPIVAIVGRPNVGKSTLFNRFAGHRRALALDEPGITRDRIAEEVEVSGRRVLLVDTAGLDPDAQAGLAAAIQAQARSAIAGADAILFLVDGKAGLLPEDAELARLLRRSDKPVTLVVNKIDVPEHALRLGEFHRLGIERTRGVSAEHGGGAWDALEEIVALLPESPPDLAPAAGEGVRIAVVGRPNVGKSSIVNRLVGEERVVVSDVPGTTRDAIDVRVEHAGQRFLLVDTAGLRRAGRRILSAERGSALMTVRALERANVAMVVIDAVEGATDQDARVANLSLERGCAVGLILNKWDLVAGQGEAQIARLLDEVRRRLRFLGEAPLLTVSAKTGAGIGRIFELSQRLAAAVERKIGTAELNRWLSKTVALHDPAMAQRGPRRKPVKFYYATQMGTRPPTFVLFCSEPDAVQSSYRRFLENQLRESFDLAGAPVRLRLRSRH
ncbi:MAG TPA: ribosome biogenesis GTPase Der [Myxococcota bacterium]|jgi:GTP-binding protein